MIAAPPTKPSKPIENPQVPPPPKVEQAATPAPPPLAVTQIPAKPPAPAPAPKPKRTRRVVAAKAAPVPPPPVQAAAVPPSASPGEGEGSLPASDQPSIPVLAPVLSAGQQVAFNRAIDVAVDEAQAGLTEVRGKALSQIQRANADRALSFIEQAQQLRGSDLVTAKSLADRAVVLARALVAETR